LNLIESMSAEVEKKALSLVLLPIGSLEQHGSEAPLGCDSIIAEHICRKAGNETGCSVLPCMFYGNSLSHTAFPGTFTLSEAAFSTVIGEIISEAERNGYGRMIILSGHGGNRKAAEKAVIGSPGGISAEYLGYWELPGVSAEEERLFGKTGHHVTTSEVSMVWNILNRPVPGVFKGRYPAAPADMAGMSPGKWRAAFPGGGVGGDMSRVSVEKGGDLLEFIIGSLARKIQRETSS
jgi:creatinine amidohydrolase